MFNGLTANQSINRELIRDIIAAFKVKLRNSTVHRPCLLTSLICQSNPLCELFLYKNRKRCLYVSLYRWQVSQGPRSAAAARLWMKRIDSPKYLSERMTRSPRRRTDRIPHLRTFDTVESGAWAQQTNQQLEATTVRIHSFRDIWQVTRNHGRFLTHSNTNLDVFLPNKLRIDLCQTSVFNKSTENRSSGVRVLPQAHRRDLHGQKLTPLPDYRLFLSVGTLPP